MSVSKPPKNVASPSLLGRMARKLSSARKAHPHRFVFEPKRLLIDTDEGWRPVEHIVLLFRHRQRQFRSKMRTLEDSFSVGNRRLIVWPDRVVDDPIEFVTTLYNRRKNNIELDDKEWTLVVEGPMAQTTSSSTTKEERGVVVPRRPLAAAELNMRMLIGPADCVAQVRLQLRPLHPGVLSCSLDLVVRCFLPSDGNNHMNTIGTTPVNNIDTTLMDSIATIPTNNLTTTPKSSIGTTPTDNLSATSKSNIGTTPIGSLSASKNNIATTFVDNICTTLMDNIGATPTNNFTTTPINNIDTIFMDNIGTTLMDNIDAAPTSNLATTHKNSIGTISTSNLATTHKNSIGTTLTNNLATTHKNSIGTTPTNNLATTHNNTIGTTPTNNLATTHKNSIGITPTNNLATTHKNNIGTTTIRRIATTPMDNVVTTSTGNFSARARELADQLTQCLRQIAEVEQQDIFVGERMLEMAPGSAAETELINHHLRLIAEKEQLSRRQDLLNAQLDLNETEQRISQLHAKLMANDAVDGGQHNGGTGGGSSFPFFSPIRHEHNKALLMELKQQIDHKNDLVMRISDYEDEEEA